VGGNTDYLPIIRDIIAKVGGNTDQLPTTLRDLVAGVNSFGGTADAVSSSFGSITAPILGIQRNTDQLPTTLHDLPVATQGLYPLLSNVADLIAQGMTPADLAALQAGAEKVAASVQSSFVLLGDPLTAIQRNTDQLPNTIHDYCVWGCEDRRNTDQLPIIRDDIKKIGGNTDFLPIIHEDTSAMVSPANGIPGVITAVTFSTKQPNASRQHRFPSHPAGRLDVYQPGASAGGEPFSGNTAAQEVPRGV